MRLMYFMKLLRYALGLVAISAMAGDVQWIRDYLGNGERGIVRFGGRGDLRPMKSDPSRLEFWGFPKNFSKRQRMAEIPYSRITRLEYQSVVTPKQGTTQMVTTPRSTLAEGIAADITNSIMNT